ncbi:membrane protein insertion efficiency factor YidD [Candidatus Nomurabacteria bacterium]|nr:membrane protein insertion efficiency factor YidD [Candidatus Nomurabacteria bacterium]
MKNFLLKLINLYQKTPLKSHSSCVFIPTCSEYTKEAIIKYGSILGVYKGFVRILRCHPWQKSHYDPLV